MRISTKRILSIGLSVALFIGVAIIYFNLIVPEAKNISKERGEIASKQSLFNVQKQAVDEVQKLIAQFRNLPQLQASVSLAMPAGSDTIGALRQINAVAKTTNATVTSLGFKITPPFLSASKAKITIVKPMGNVNVTVSARGVYENLKKFLELVEKNIRVANVRTFKFTPGMGKEAGVGDALDLSIDMFYQNPTQ